MTVLTMGNDAPSLQARVNRIAFLLARRDGALTAADVAAIRRMDPRSPAVAFFKLAVLALDQGSAVDSPAMAETEVRWAAIVSGLALLGQLHQPAARLGQSLATSGFSELRFSRLLRADAERLVDELPMLARFLAAKGTPADWSTSALLILSAGRSDEESTRRRIAREYYAAVSRNEH